MTKRRLIFSCACVTFIGALILLGGYASANGRVSAVYGHTYLASDSSCMTLTTNNAVVNNCGRYVVWEFPFTLTGGGGANVNATEWSKYSSATPLNQITLVGCTMDNVTCYASGPTYIGSPYDVVRTWTKQVYLPAWGHLYWESNVKPGTTIYGYEWQGL